MASETEGKNALNDNIGYLINFCHNNNNNKLQLWIPQVTHHNAMQV